MSEAKGYRGIEVIAEASPTDKLRKQVIAGQPGHGAFAFMADEGSYMPGGEGSAPTPLTYFVAGVALCLLSHVQEIAGMKKMVLKDARVKVAANFHEQGSVLQGTKEGACDGFDIAIEIDADHSQEEIEVLMQMAHNTCFAEDALTNEIPIKFKDKFNGEAISV